MSVLTDFDRDYFRQYGYVVLEGLLTRDELRDYLELFHEDRRKAPLRWPLRGIQHCNCDALVTTPEFDRPIRHPFILAAIEELMGGPVCFGELCARHMDPADTASSQGWHRDRPHWPEHPLHMDYIQLMLYLTDVDETTHCFSISPESADQPILQDRQAQLARDGQIDIHGPAGTVCLFNVSVLHRATGRKTDKERKTLQAYYGHRDRPYLADDSIIPPVFFMDPDPETRAFYGNINDITRVYLRGFGMEEPAS